MSLTKADLQAIEDIIDRRIGAIIEERVRPMFEELEERFSIKIENGFQEVRDQLYRVQNTVDSIERVQQAELVLNDNQDVAITKIRKALHSA